ncbi:TonB-dependent receptor [Mariniphaga sediminis]|uniref:TonB-dependent receptor n=1 Tax=Mariniphaga sediminis TaxID=1628158 RepID=UPI0035639C7B
MKKNERIPWEWKIPGVQEVLRAMKLTIFLLLTSVISVFANKTYSQTKVLNLKLESKTVKEVLQRIEDQSEFYFMYSEKLVDVQREVSVDFQNKKINWVLDELFEGTSVNYKIQDRFILLTTPEAMGSDATDVMQRSVSGIVKDESGQALPGVTVLVKGSAQGTVTSASGEYSFANLPEDAVLQFSFVGMRTQEIEVKGQSTINVTMEASAVGIEEVVAIGYGTLKKKDLTSSVVTISPEDMNKGVVRDPVLALQGKVPGLNIAKDGSPYGGTSILLRGASTLRGSQSPIYVVDGMTNAVMPPIDDIASIDILKDASATAIYGSRAANGVILITTKRGKSGKQVISYNGYVGVETISNKIDMLSADEYRAYLSDNGLSLNPEDEMNANTDWQDEMTRVGVSHKNNISISGGNNRTTYISSIEYFKQEGIIIGTSYDRLNMRGTIEQYGFNDKLKLQFQVGGVISNSERLLNEHETLLNMLQFQPTYAVKNPDGSYAERVSTSPYNPVALVNQHDYDVTGKSMFGNARAELNIIEGLDYVFNASYNTGQSMSGQYYSKNSRVDQGSNGRAIRSSYGSESKLMETFATYSKEFQNQSVKLMAGYSWQEDKSGDGFQSSNINFVSDDLKYNNLGIGSGYDGYVAEYGTTTMRTLRMISGYARLNYELMDKYLLQATIRRDGSSAFGRNERWGTFPSASVGWRVMEEPFIKNMNVFDNLKLRAGYGESGNSMGFDPLISILRYGSGGSFYYKGAWLTGITPTQNESPDLKWERTSMLNFALDFALFDSRLSGTVEYYNKVTKDLIWDYEVPATQYFVNSIVANVGEIENKGWEVALSATPVMTRDFSWTTSANVAFNDNKIVSLSNDVFQVEYVDIYGVGQHGQSGNRAFRIQEGYPIGQFCLWQYAGENEDGISQFLDKDGNLTINPSTQDRIVTDENAQPKAIFGWHNMFTYRNFSLDFLFRGVTGNHILNVTAADLNYPSEVVRFNVSKLALNEKVNNTRANYTSTRYLEKGDYLRLDNITLSYSPKISSAYLQKLTIYTTVNNAFVITNYSGVDPEVNIGGLTPGVDDSNLNPLYPKTRSFVFGVSVDF